MHPPTLDSRFLLQKHPVGAVRTLERVWRCAGRRGCWFSDGGGGPDVEAEEAVRMRTEDSPKWRGCGGSLSVYSQMVQRGELAFVFYLQLFCKLEMIFKFI